MTLMQVSEEAKARGTKPTAIKSLSDLSVADEYGRARAWLDQQVAKSQKAPTATPVKLTPALAEVLLNRNPDNRRISEALVNEMARDIRNDAFKFNGEPIIVSKDGLLNDGQHRCSAVMSAGRPIEVILVVGVDRETRTTVDQGKIRTVGDYLGMEGMEHGADVAAVSRLLLVYQSSGTVRTANAQGRGRQSKFSPTKSEVLNFARDNAAIVKAIENTPKKNVKVFGGRPALAFLLYVLAQRAGWPAATAFVDTLVNGANLDKKSPILYVRSRFVVEQGKLRPHERMELMFRAWNAYRLKQSPTMLKIMGGRLPSLEA